MLEPLEPPGPLRRGEGLKGEKEEVMAGLLKSPCLLASVNPVSIISARPWWHVTQETGWGT